MRSVLLEKSKKACLCLFIGGFLVSGSGQSTMTFNVDGANAVVAHEVFGLLMERLGRQWTNNGIFVGTNSTIANTNGMRNDVIEGFKECGVGAAQWPGGCAANGYAWQNNKKPANDVGVDRFIQFCQLTGAEAMISGKPTANDVASNRAFASYIIDSLKYPLKWFKFGNEIWGGCGTNYTSGYATANGSFAQNVNSLKTLRDTPLGKDLKFIAAAGATEGGYGWIPTYYNAIGSIMDAIEYHDYIYRTSWSSSNPSTSNYWQIMNDIFVGDFHGHLFNNIIPAMKTADPSKRVKICFDEWGDWLQGDNWMQTITVMDAISAGGHLNQFIQNADIVGAACLAQGVNVIHSLININTSGVMVKTPAFYVFKMYKPHHANNAKCAPLTASNYENTNNVPAVSGAATVDAGSYVNVSLTNCDLSATRRATVTLTTSHAGYRVVSADVVTGAAYTSTNPFGGAEQVNIKPLDASAYSITGKVLSVTLPSKSVVMVRLFPTDVAVEPAGIRQNGTGVFSVKAGSNRTLQVSSSVGHGTLATISLYSADGRALVDAVSTRFVTGKNTVAFDKRISKGMYVVKIVGANIDHTEKVAFTR